MNQDARKSHTLAEIVALYGGQVVGDPEVAVSQVATLEQAQPWHLSFFSNPKYRSQLQQTRAGAVVLGPDHAGETSRPRIVAENPYAYFAKVTAFFNPPAQYPAGIHPSAVVEASARIADSASIGPFAYIGKNARVGEGAVILAGCLVGDGAEIGNGALLYPRVTVYHDCVIGERCILHSGAVIGADGFGMAMDGGRWIKIPQVGRVVIGDDVEIGANTTIDRGTLNDTVVEEGVKLDNQIQIGHNVVIGAHTAIAGCVGIAGSTRIGRYCRIGGAAMIIGHLEIADHVNISAGTFVAKSIREPGTYTSSVPCLPHRDWLRNSVHLRHLDRLVKTLGELERKKP